MYSQNWKGRRSSRKPTSFENLFKTLPMGLVSKNSTGTLKMEANILLWRTRELFTQTKKNAMVLVRLSRMTARTDPPYTPTLWSRLSVHSCLVVLLVSSSAVRFWLEQSAQSASHQSLTTTLTWRVCVRAYIVHVNGLATLSFDTFVLFAQAPDEGN